MTLHYGEISEMHPVEFLDPPWLVKYRLNLLIGEEEIGKSTLQAYIAAQVTRGEFNGGKPELVIFVGSDEDDWASVTLPRLYAMRADLEHVALFIPKRHDRFDIEELRNDFRSRRPTLAVFEHILDSLPPLSNPNDPFEVRAKSRPLRHLLAETLVTGIGGQHVNKADAGSFRQRAQSSVQYNALARSSIAIGHHPSEPDRRAFVLGKANYTDRRPVRSFRLEPRLFDANRHTFNVGVVGDMRDESKAFTPEQVLGGSPDGHAPTAVRDELALQLLALLTGVGGVLPIGNDTDTLPGSTIADLARAVGRDPKNRTVRVALDELAGMGFAHRDKRKRWHAGQPVTEARNAIHDDEPIEAEP